MGRQSKRLPVMASNDTLTLRVTVDAQNIDDNAIVVMHEILSAGGFDVYDARRTSYTSDGE